MPLAILQVKTPKPANSPDILDIAAENPSEAHLETDRTRVKMPSPGKSGAAFLTG